MVTSDLLVNRADQLIINVIYKITTGPERRDYFSRDDMYAAVNI